MHCAAVNRPKTRVILHGERAFNTTKTRNSGIETNLYYYGARYLDPKTSRWISTDPAMGDYIPGAPINDEVRKQNKNLPNGGIFNYSNLHVYHYSNNNPIKYSDPDGKFPLRMHAKMVKTAFSSKLPKSIVHQLSYGASSLADIGKYFDANVHMDGVAGTSAVINAYNDAIEKFLSKMIEGDYEGAGVAIHTIADFYSHSNYIEMYQRYAESNGLPMDTNSIPTYTESMQNSDFMKFVENEGGLRTGTYNGYWNDRSTSNPNAHGQMNLDNAKSKNSQRKYNENGDTRHTAARAAAQKALNCLVD